MRCPQCDHANPTNANFCNACGVRFGAAAGRAQFEAIDGERRHLTLLFCDLAGSTEIASRIDAEQWHELAARYQQEATAAVAKFGGHVGKYLGDGVDAYFGYPNALEDAAERGVRAGLAIVDAMGAINARYAKPLGVTLAVRVGLHAGTVVIAPGGDLTLDVFGSVPHIAARVQTAAESNTVVMTAAVHDAVAGKFLVADLGEHVLKGIATPVRLFRAANLPYQHRPAPGKTPRVRSTFVGRNAELNSLRSLCALARDGAGQTALIVGEPGIGKTRLLEELRAALAEATPHAWVHCAGEPLFTNAPFHAVKQILQQLNGPNDDAPEALSAFTALLDGAVDEPARENSAEEKRRRLLEMLVDVVVRAASTQLLVVAVEDLQWVDPSTAAFLERLTAKTPGLPLFVVCTRRPELDPPPLAAHTHIELNRLGADETRTIVRDVIGASMLDAGTVESAAARADGVPLFAEELARFVTSAGAQSGAHEIPATLQDSLAARLSRLGPAKEIAQLGAVIGREFNYELLHALSSMPEADLRSALGRLVEAGLIEMDGAGACRFTHALIQDAAYDGLLKRQCRILHGRVARVLVGDFPTLAESQPGLLAHHWSEAGVAAHAVEAWTLAAKSATARYAYREAADAIERAIAQCQAQEPSGKRDLQELELWRRLVGASQVAYGYSAAKTAQATETARALADKTGDPRKQFARLAAEWMTTSSAGKYRDARALADRLVALAQAGEASDAIATGYMALVTSCCRMGDLADAERAFAAGEAHFDDPNFCKRAGAAAQAFGNAAISAWLIGDVAAAEQRIARVRVLAQESENPYEQAFSNYMAGMVALMLGDMEVAVALASRSIEVSQRGDFPQFAAQSSIVFGCAYTEQGNSSEGLQRMREGLQRMEAMGSRAGMSLYLTWFAAAQRSCGESAGALDSVARALTINAEELYFRPEALRLRGEMRLEAGDVVGARADLNEAAALARSMQANMLLQRASASLARTPA